MTNHLSIIWLHAIWSTEDRKRDLSKDFRFRLFRHMKEYSTTKGIHLDIINGVEDHVHCLIRLKTTERVSEILQLIKGESSRWINKNVILDHEFRWQKGYGVFSLNQNDVLKVRKYIYNQEKHHKNMSYDIELKNLVPKTGKQD